MLRNIIEGHSTEEIFTVSADMKRGTAVVKNLSTSKADKADSTADIYFLDFNYVPTGYQSDLEISDYDATADTVKANTKGILKRLVSGVWATDQIDVTGTSAGDYLIAGATDNVGLLVKATVGQISKFKYLGTFDDAGHTLHQFEVVEPKTIA